MLSHSSSKDTLEQNDLGFCHPCCSKEWFVNWLFSFFLYLFICKRKSLSLISIHHGKDEIIILEVCLKKVAVNQAVACQLKSRMTWIYSKDLFLLWTKRLQKTMYRWGRLQIKQTEGDNYFFIACLYLFLQTFTLDDIPVVNGLFFLPFTISNILKTERMQIEMLKWI